MIKVTNINPANGESIAFYGNTYEEAYGAAKAAVEECGYACTPADFDSEEVDQGEDAEEAAAKAAAEAVAAHLAKGERYAFPNVFDLTTGCWFAPGEEIPEGWISLYHSTT